MATVIEISQPEIGRRLAALRRDRGLTQRELADANVTPSYVSLLESGVRVPTLDVVVRLARTLGVPLSELIGADAGEVDERSAASRSTPADSADSADRVLAAVLARSATAVGDLDEARHRYQAALDHARAEHSDLGMLEYGLALQEIYRVQELPQQRDELLAELESSARRLGIPELLAKVHSERAAAARDNARLVEALELAEQSVREAAGTALRNTGEYVRMLGILISIRCETGRTSEVAALVDEMLGAAAAVGSRSILGRAHWVAAMAYVRIRRPDLVAAQVQAANDALVSASTPMHDWARFTRVAATTLLDVGASTAEVGRYLSSAKSAAAVVDHLPAERGLLRLLEARVALAAGNPAAALALGEPDPMLPVATRVQWHLAHGRALAATGTLTLARAELQGAAELADQRELYQLASQVWRELDAMGR